MILGSAVFRAVGAFVLALLLAHSADAQRADHNNEATETRQADAVSRKVFDKLQQIIELNDSEDYTRALELIDDLYKPDKLTDYEQSQVLQYKGSVLYNLGDVPASITAFSAMLDIPDIEASARKQTLYTLAQLYASSEQFPQALTHLELWFDEDASPAPTAYVFLAQIRYQLSDYAGMIVPLETAIAQAQSGELREEWYTLLSFAYFQREDYASVRDVQKILLERWPRKRYWTTLAGAYSEIGNDRELVSAYSVAYADGLLTLEAEFVTLAQLYMQAQVPYKAAVLPQEQMDDGTIAPDERNFRLLSQAWSLAQEHEKALPALSRAAGMRSDGELDVRLANTFLSVGRYAECIAAARRGLEKGNLKDPGNAQVSLGMCLYNDRNYSASIQAFNAARLDPATRTIAMQWLGVIRNELERANAIEDSRERTQRKLEDVRKRRLLMHSG